MEHKEVDHMNTVRRMLRPRNIKVWTIGPHALVADALTLMAEHDVSALVVVEHTSVVGIVTERDYVRKVALAGRSASETTVGEIMTQKVLYVRPEQNINDCMALMTEKHVRHLPVIDEGQLIAVISIRDVVAHIISEQGFIIGQLESYILDRHPAQVNAAASL
jgi:CBS domain-containing protein